MPRPSLGEGRKSIVATVRLTQAECSALEREYGSMSRGLRVALDKMLGQVTPRHLHKRGKVTGRVMVNGSEVLTYACREPGCDAVLR